MDEYAIAVLDDVENSTMDPILRSLVYQGRSSAYIEMYDLDSAISELRKLIKMEDAKKEDLFRSFLIIGQIEEERSNFSLAIKAYKQALELNCQNRTAYAHLAL